MEHVCLSDDVAVIKIIGELDVYTAPRGRELFIELFNSGYTRLVFDMTQMEYLDSTGLGVVVGMLKRCRAKSGMVALVPGNFATLAIFMKTGLYKVFRILDDVAAATAIASDRDRWKEPPGPHEVDGSRKYFPLWVDTAERHQTDRVQAAMLTVLDTFSIELLFRFLGDYGARALMGIKQSAGPISLSEQLDAMCSCIAAHLDAGGNSGPAAERDKAIASLMTVLRHVPEVVIHVEFVVLVKYKDEVIVRNLPGGDFKKLWKDRRSSEPAHIFSILQCAPRPRKLSRG